MYEYIFLYIYIYYIHASGDSCCHQTHLRFWHQKDSQLVRRPPMKHPATRGGSNGLWISWDQWEKNPGVFHREMRKSPMGTSKKKSANGKSGNHIFANVDKVYRMVAIITGFGGVGSLIHLWIHLRFMIDLSDLMI